MLGDALWCMAFRVVMTWWKWHASLSQYASSRVSFICFLHLSITSSWGILFSCHKPETFLMLMEILKNFTVAMFPPSSTMCWAVSLLLTAWNLHTEATLTLKYILDIIQWYRHKPLCGLLSYMHFQPDSDKYRLKKNKWQFECWTVLAEGNCWKSSGFFSR